MKSYHQDIVISNQDDIREYFKNHIDQIQSGETEIIEFSKDSKEAEWIIENILPDVEKYSGKKHELHRAIVFGQGPNSYPKEHVDGFWPPKPNAIIWSLNIPIKNCEQGEMLWYEGDLELRTIPDAPDYDGGFHPNTRTNVRKLNSLEIHWKEDKRLKDSVVVDKPTIVQVNIPHQVINHKNDTRAILAVRFTPDIF
jgi:hypothetical protein